MYIMTVMSYFGLHPVSACDELSVTSSFFGQPIDKSRAGPSTNPERETPTQHKALEHGTYSVDSVIVCCVLVRSPVGT